MNLHLLSFGSPSEKYNWTLSRLKKEAEYLNVFKTINIFTEKNIFDFCSDLKPYENFMQSSRGYGYWIWKYFLVSKLFENLLEGDILLYLDAGCSINENGIERLEFYYEMAEKNNIVAFKMEHLEKKYTKKDTYLRVIGEDLKFYDEGQVQASCFLIKKTKSTIDFIDEIKSICVDQNYHYINDGKSLNENDETFIEHRHDQSVFSLMCKKHNAFLINDETYWEPNWNLFGKEYPIWVTRIR